MSQQNLSYHGAIALIKEIKKHPELWDVNHRKYNKRFLMASAWKEIAGKLNMPEKLLKSKWINLRDIFAKQLRKSNSKSVEGYTGKWKHFYRLAFIKDRYQNEDENVNMTEEENNLDEFADENCKDKSHETDVNKAQIEAGYLSDYEIKNNSKCTEWNDYAYDNREQIYEMNDDNETIVEFIIQNEDGNHSYHDRPEEITYIEEENKSENAPAENIMYYEAIFLKSLAPYFKQLNPLRKLVMRSKIQNLLLKEIASQNYSGVQFETTES